MSVVGDRYAESLFDLAKEENQVTQYLDDIK
jgi:F-type H+-transporting ATPase subunit delta